MARIGTVIFPVTDLAAAKAEFASLLGAEPAVDQPYYVGFVVDGQDIGLDPNGHAKGLTGPLVYWHVGDIGIALDTLISAGATEREAVHDVGGGKLVATVYDRDRNIVGLVQPPPPPLPPA